MTIFCRAPSESVCIHATGKLVPCCAIRLDDSLSNVNGNISDFYNDPVFKDIRKSLNENEYNKYCLSCKEGTEKKVDVYKNKINGIIAHRSPQFEPGKLKHLDIAFSNTCNLACAMCGNKWSSKWNELTKTAPEEILKMTNQERQFTNTLSFEDIDELLDNSRDLVRVVIKGGEPLYDKKTLYYLENLLEIRPDIDVTIVTNFTIFNEKILTKFPNLKLNLSIDGIDKTYEYIRGFDFEVIKENFIKASELKRQMEIHYTMTAYNLHQTLDTYKLFSNLSIKYDNRNNFGWLTSYAKNSYVYINNISEENYLKAAKTQEPLVRIPKYKSPTDNQLKKFETYTKWLDSTRGFSWYDIDKVY
jgi:MoaA/NifB/PqqE/SkfB family radical SAM enzyme